MFTNYEKLQCVRREIEMRRRVYAGRVFRGQMTQAYADSEIALMEEIAADYAAKVEPKLDLC